MGAVASRGVTWAADKVSKTEAYKEWEKKPAGMMHVHVYVCMYVLKAFETEAYKEWEKKPAGMMHVHVYVCMYVLKVAVTRCMYV